MCKDPNVGIKQIPLKAEIPAHTPSLVDSSKKPGKHRFHRHLVHLIFTATKQSYKIIVFDMYLVSTNRQHRSVIRTILSSRRKSTYDSKSYFGMVSHEESGLQNTAGMFIQNYTSMRCFEFF